MLQANSTIRALYLGHNDVGARGAAAIADALKTTTSLGNLTIRDNVGDEGAVALADALRSRASVRDLTLSTRFACCVCWV